MKQAYIGVDIGSTTVKIVGVDHAAQLLGTPVCLRHDAFSSQVEALKAALQRYLDTTDIEVLGIGTTGSGRELNRKLLGAKLTRTEIFAHAVGIHHLVSTGAVDVDRLCTVIEIGGQDSKVIRFDDRGNPVFFNMNSICAAGTGEFLKQLSDEAGIDVADFGEWALKAENPAYIDSTCTVFSRRDFRHLTQKGVPLPERLMGVAHALVNNYFHNVLEGYPPQPPVIFQGGVAFNKAVCRAFEERFGETVVVPPLNDVVGALGMALIVRDELGEGRGDERGQPPWNRSFFEEEYHSRIRYCHGCPNSCELTQPLVNNGRGEATVLDTLGGRCEGCQNADNVHKNPPPAASGLAEIRTEEARRWASPVVLPPSEAGSRETKGLLFAGIDGGSRGTKWAVIESGGPSDVEVVEVGFIDTAGDAVEAILSALRDIREVVEDRGREELLGSIGTTGSAGELAQHILCTEVDSTADHRSTEIIAHYTWARRMVPEVGTVMDIGGNDAKIITVQETGLDFAMNDKCAAGTGSFLETVARRFSVPIDGYAETALAAERPAHIAGRCAVFGESDVVHKARLGFATPDLLAGVAHSVARTYLSDVAKGKVLQLPIVAQGGVFLNGAVVRAFEQLLDVEAADFFVASDPLLVVGAGALGAAVLAKEMYGRGFPCTFKGFGRVLSTEFTTQSVSCSYEGCPRDCSGLVVLMEGGSPAAGYKSVDCPFGLFDGLVTEDQQEVVLNSVVNAT